MCERLSRRQWTLSLVMLSLVCLVWSPAVVLAATEDPGPPSGSQVLPTWVEGNPTCADLGYDRGFKPQPQPPPTGQHTLPDSVNTISITTDGFFIDWLSSLSIDAVIVKGGPNANLFGYDPPTEAFDDNSLHAPVNPANEKLYEISHVEFCYDYDKVRTGVIVIGKGGPGTGRVHIADFQSNTLPDAFQVEAGESLIFQDQPSGYTYLFTETVPAGWELSDIGCEGTAASTITIGAAGDFDPGDERVAIDLAAGERVVCTFTNVPITPPNTGVELPAPVIIGGLAVSGLVLLATGGVMAHQVKKADR